MRMYAKYTVPTLNDPKMPFNPNRKKWHQNFFLNHSGLILPMVPKINIPIQVKNTTPALKVARHTQNLTNHTICKQDLKFK